MNISNKTKQNLNKKLGIFFNSKFKVLEEINNVIVIPETKINFVEEKISEENIDGVLENTVDLSDNDIQEDIQEIDASIN